MSGRVHTEVQAASKSNFTPVQNGIIRPNSTKVNEVLASPGQPLNTNGRFLLKPHLGHDFNQVSLRNEPRSTVGKPLDSDTSIFLENRLGMRFDDVRINSGDGQIPINALAAAQGNQISMVPWLEEAPKPIRRAVVAHEAAHVLQWRRGQQLSGQPWSEQSLETEAHEVGMAAANGRASSVQGVARNKRIRFHPIFISTFGSQGFLNLARDYHIRWGYGNPRSVNSIEEIVTDLGAGTGHIDRMTIVSHATPDTINMSFLRGGPGFVAETDWDLTSREALTRYSAHPASRGLADQVMDGVRRNPANRDLLARLGSLINEPRMLQFIWWLVDADLLARVQPGNAIPNRQMVVNGARQNAQRYEEMLKTILRDFASYGYSTAREEDMDALEQVINDVLRSFHYDPISRQTGTELSQQVRSGRDTAVQRVLEQTMDRSAFQLSLLYTRTRFNSSSVIQIKGCRIGQNRSYLEAISRFFAWPNLSGPTVTAPNMFQIFGTLALRSHPDNIIHLRGLWRNRNFRQAFLYWAQVFGWALSNPPVTDDLVAVLRAGHAFPVGMVLHLLAGSNPGSVTAWFARFGYHLSNAPDIESTFFTGRSLPQAMRYTIIDWLQERGWGQPPGRIIFPPDPDYQNHIRSAQMRI